MTMVRKRGVYFLFFGDVFGGVYVAAPIPDTLVLNTPFVVRCMCIRLSVHCQWLVL